MTAWLTLLLSGIAIVLGVLALLPYILEFYFRRTCTPKFRVTINNTEVKRTTTDPTATLVNFDLSWTLIQGKPFFLDSAVLILPPSARPLSTAWKDPKGVELQWGMYLEQGEWPPPTAITLESEEPESWYSNVVPIYHVSFEMPNLPNDVALTLRWRLQIDRAKLSWWGIFYHASSYLLYKDLKVSLAHSEPQHFE